MMMHQLFTENGEMIPVTFLQVHPNFIAQIKTKKKDGYDAVQVATAIENARTNLKKPQIHHFKKAKIDRVDFCSEMLTTTDLKVGDELPITHLVPGMYVDITATSKGKGTAGVIKRHNFSRGPMTHGSKHHRAPGSVGLSKPDKIWKGQPLPGRMGNVRVTTKNMEVIHLIPEERIVAVRGTVPGFPKNWIKICESTNQPKTLKPAIMFNTASFFSKSNPQPNSSPTKTNQTSSEPKTEQKDSSLTPENN